MVCVGPSYSIDLALFLHGTVHMAYMFLLPLLSSHLSSTQSPHTLLHAQLAKAARLPHSTTATSRTILRPVSAAACGVGVVGMCPAEIVFSNLKMCTFASILFFVSSQL